MNLLLDTCTFLWFLADAPELSPRARDLIGDPGHDVFLSVISVWEIARKHAGGTLVLGTHPSILIPEVRHRLRIASLEFDENDALASGKLPLHHKDPFDRMLIAQALMNGLTIVTPDAHFNAYPVRTLW